MNIKLIPVLIAVFIAAPLMGQQSSGSGMSTEESYTQESVELMIIRETSRTDVREQKLKSLEYIGNAIEKGNTSDEIVAILESLSLEGTLNRATENKRVVNTHPEVRREAVRYLGIVGGEEAKAILIKVLTVEKEPLVLQEAVKSLGLIDSDENDVTVTKLAWLANRYTYGKAPDELLAIAIVETLDKIARKNNGIRDRYVAQALIAISEGRYTQQVRAFAWEVLENLSKYSQNESGQKN